MRLKIISQALLPEVSNLSQLFHGIVIANLLYILGCISLVSHQTVLVFCFQFFQIVSKICLPGPVVRQVVCTCCI